MTDDPELLTDLSDGELHALADGMLSPSAQARLDELLQQNSEGKISPAELQELDQLLNRVDQLTILKTRARYTLQSQKVGAGEP